MSEGISVDIPSPSDFVGLDSSLREQVIDVLPTALEIGHGISDGHERG